MADESSNLTRFQPRHAAMAAGHPHKAYDRQVQRILTQIAERRRLPRTQMEYDEQRRQQPQR